MNLYHGGQVILELGWFELFESMLIANRDLNVIFGHLTFEALLQSQNGRMNRILEFNIVNVSAICVNVYKSRELIHFNNTI